MTVHIVVEDASGNVVNDIDGTLEQANSVTWESMFPKGHAGAKFSVQRDIAERWAVKKAHVLLIYDGLRLCYQGVIKDLEAAISGSNEQTITVQARGYYSYLNFRNIRKRWVDTAPYQRLKWPDSQIGDQVAQRLGSTIEGELILIKLPGQAVTSNAGDAFLWEYNGVPTDVIYKVTHRYDIEAGDGETLQLRILNGATVVSTVQATSNTRVQSTHDTGAFTGGDTADFTLQWRLDAVSGDNDADGIANCTDLTVYFEIDYIAGLPNYYADEIIRDIIDLTTDEFSADTDLIASPSLALIPFTTKGDGFETAATVIERAIGYGDSSNNAWAFNVWDRETGGAASDGKPKMEIVQQPATTDWEYQMWLEEFDSFQYSQTTDELYNYVTVQYTDPDGKNAFISPDTNSTLKDDTSIALYGRREVPGGLSIGDSTSAKALEYGERYLGQNKDPKPKTSMAVSGRIRTKHGIFVEVSNVRAGERIRIPDYQDGLVIVIGKASHTANGQSVSIEGALPPDNFATFTTQLQLQAAKSVA